MLKKDERVQHTVAQFQPAEDDLLRIHAALNEEMGYAFQVQVADIIHRRDHVLAIQETANGQEGEMQVMSVAPVAVIENFDDIEMVPCDCEMCRAGGRHHDAAGSRVDKELIEQVAYGGGRLAESERFAECVKPERRSIEEHVTLSEYARLSVPG